MKIYANLSRIGSSYYMARVVTRFVSIEHSRDLSCEDCMNMVVIFENHEMLMAWVEHADHQKVIDDLDAYRTKGQRWHVSIDGSAPDLELWEEAFLA